MTLTETDGGSLLQQAFLRIASTKLNSLTARITPETLSNLPSRTSSPVSDQGATVSISRTAKNLAYAYAPAYKPPDAMPKTAASTRALLAGGIYWWHDSAAGTATSTADGLSTSEHTLTYSFRTSAGLSNQKGFKEMSDAEKAAVVSALNYLSSIADITFKPAAPGTDGDLQYGKTNQNYVSAGYAYYPNAGSVGGQVYLANEYFKSTTDLSSGTYAYETIIHETGHALGLKHPGPYNAGGGTTPGPYLSAGQDNRLYTVMSYNNPGNARVVSGSISGNRVSVSWTYVNPSNYQQLDIKALQYLYGPSTNAHITSAEDGSTQVDNPSAEATDYIWDDGGDFLQTIWNTNPAGAIDASNQSGRNVIDLRGGHFSSIGIHNPYADLPAGLNTAQLYALRAPGAAKPTYTGKNNVAIAAGSHIDTAIGGNAGNRIVGNNDAANTILGGAGNDKIFLGKANSTVTGGGGTDKVFLPKISRTTKWTVVNNHDGTYTATAADTKTNATLCTDTLSGISDIRIWNGTAFTAIGKNLA